jgi:hypothetical protein
MVLPVLGQLVSHPLDRKKQAIGIDGFIENVQGNKALGNKFPITNRCQTRSEVKPTTSQGHGRR